MGKKRKYEKTKFIALFWFHINYIFNRYVEEFFCLFVFFQNWLNFQSSPLSYSRSKKPNYQITSNKLIILMLNRQISLVGFFLLLSFCTVFHHLYPYIHKHYEENHVLWLVSVKLGFKFENILLVSLYYVIKWMWRVYQLLASKIFVAIF